MQDQRHRDRARIDGRAAFAAAAHLMGIGLIFLLARVGAPDGLVRTLGPLFALSGVALLGVLIRSQGVPGFFAAGRAVPPLYGALAFAAIAAGLVVCLRGPGGSPLPAISVALGLLVGALAIGPMLRAVGASAASDLIATRFPSLAVRLPVAGIACLIGVLVATAGLETATDTLASLLQLSRASAAGVVAVVIALVLAPGGIAGLIWAAAASGGILLVALYAPVAGEFLAGAGPIASNGAGWGDALANAWSAGDPQMSTVAALAGALAVAAMAPLTAPAMGAAGPRQAFQAGGLGLICVGLIGLAAIANPAAPSRLTPMAGGLATSALLIAASMLAAAGVHSASRAWGLTNAGLDQPHPPLASQRLALSRLMVLVLVASCAALSDKLIIGPGQALVAAAVLALGLIAPVLALALFSRATSIHAGASLVVGVATLAILGVLEVDAPSAERLLLAALSAASAGFAVGWSVAIFAPGRRKPSRPLSDLFIDAPLDPAPDGRRGPARAGASGPFSR